MAVTVVARDATGKLVPGYNGSVTVALVNPAGATLLGNATKLAVDGVATFDDLRINRAGTNYRLQATANGLTAATSAPFDITPGPAALLAFTQEPSSAIAGVIIAPQICVNARDGFGNTATAYTGNVTVAITAGTGTSGATLSGDTTVAAAAGIGCFDLSIDKAGQG